MSRTTKVIAAALFTVVVIAVTGHSSGTPGAASAHEGSSTTNALPPALTDLPSTSVDSTPTPPPPRVATKETTPAVTRERPSATTASPGTTRLLAGPVVLRLSGSPSYEDEPKLLYVFMFRLNRDPSDRRPEARYDLGPNDTLVGRYSVLGRSFNVENDIGPFGSGRHCFIGYDDRETHDDTLDKVLVGAPVETTLRPYDSIGARRVRLGRSYRRSPKLLLTPYDLTAPRTRSILKALGCPAVTNSWYDVG